MRGLRPLFLLYGIRILEMPEVLQARPATTPPKPKILAQVTQLLPKPQRNLIATVAMDVHVKSLTL